MPVVTIFIRAIKDTKIKYIFTKSLSMLQWRTYDHSDYAFFMSTRLFTKKLKRVT